MSKCIFRENNGQCLLHSDDEVAEYCVDGPCTNETTLKKRACWASLRANSMDEKDRRELLKMGLGYDQKNISLAGLLPDVGAKMERSEE